MLIIDLPFPNSANTHYRHARGRHYVSAKGIAYRNAVKEEVERYGLKAPEGRLELSVMIYPPDKRKRDLDNHLKNLLDSLTYSALIEDDSLIDRLIIERGPIVKGGKCRIYLSKYIENQNEQTQPSL